MASSQTTTVKIDIDVHRAIEARRVTFDQSPNDILRKVFGLPDAAPDPSESTRRTGRFPYTLLGEKTEGTSLKEVYMSCLRKLAARDPRFLKRLSKAATRGRRIVARTPDALYISTPELSRKNLHSRLTGEWWVDTNLSRPMYARRLEIACEVAGLRYGVDLVLDFAIAWEHGDVRKRP